MTAAAVEIVPVRSRRLYQEIVRQVKAMIVDGRVKSGDRLPPERELAQKFLVSRTSVREALRALETLGLVEIRPGGGTFVREGPVDRVIEPLVLAMTSRRQAVGDLFEVRRVLEPAIAALAARRATPDEIQALERLLDEQTQAVAAGGTGLSQDGRFHAAMCEAAHNGAITQIVQAIMDLLAHVREESFGTPGRAARSCDDHRRILSALARRDAAAARRAMLDHVNAVEALVLGESGSTRSAAALRRARRGAPARGNRR